MKKLLVMLMLMSLGLFAACGDAGTAPKTEETKETTETAENKETGSESETDEKKDEDKKDDKAGEMSADKNIVGNASASKDHTTLVAAVKAAGLVETLSGDGPFTVFAPVNAAFEKLPKGTVDTLLKEENKDKLKGILTYHVVAGKLDAAAVAKAIKDGNGKATLKTVQGEEITAAMDGEKVVITDAKGGKSTVTAADVMNSNGVIHVVDTVMMPSK